MKKEYEIQKANYKNQLDADQKKMLQVSQEQMNQMKILEVEKFNKLKETMLSELYKSKDVVAKEVHQAVEREIVKIIPSSQLTAVTENILTQIQTVFNEHTSSLKLNDDKSTHQMQKDAHQVVNKMKRDRNLSMGMGMALGMLVFFLGESGYRYVQNKQNPVTDQIAQQAEKVKQELEEKKFTPERVPEVKDTYVDLVIYTDQFVEMYLDPTYHDRWGKAAMDYLLKTWRVEEEKSIQIVAMAQTLVKTLHEKQATVRTDFLEQGLAKMREQEQETSNKIVEILGSNVKFESFRKFEKKFFRDELEKFYLSKNSKTPHESKETPGDLQKQIDGEIEQSSKSN